MSLTSSEIVAAKRRLVLDIARRRVQPGAGSSMAFLTQRTTIMSWPNLIAAHTPLEFAVADAVATRLSMPERLTQDIDIVISVAEAEEARRKLAEAGCEHKGDLAIGGSTWRAPDGNLVAVLEGYESWWPEAISAAQANRDALGLPILPLAYLVLMRLRAGRLQDLAGASRMLGQADENAIASVRALFDRESPEERNDLESFIQLEKLEYQSPK